jgi:hypothetical protein
VRLVQKRFAADSLRSIVEAVESGGSDRVGCRFIPRQLPPLGRRNQADTKNCSELDDTIGGLDEPTRSIPGQLSEAEENATGVSR